MSDRTRATTTIDASPQTVMAVITDVASYPQWARQFSSVEVLESDAAGRPVRARFVMSAGPLKDTFVLAYEYRGTDSAPVMAWRLDQADVLKRLDGVYTVSAHGPSGSQVVYELEVELSLPVLAVLRRKAEAQVIETALSDLKARAESLA